MVAVVSGSGLGLFGSTGAAGNAALGRGGERAFVNSSTGNLVVQGVDETLTARGLDLALVRTYNSQGLLDDDNHDNWRLGVHRRLLAPTGTINVQGSTITKVFGDGREAVYEYDEDRLAYVSSEGDGAHDTLTHSGGTWTWTDGSGRHTETYDTDRRLASSTDADGNVTSYQYIGDHLRQITDASGQVVHLDYDGDNLTQIRVVSDAVTQTLTRYYYDSLDRLRQVVVDLTPEVDGATTNVTNGVHAAVISQSYVTTYGYDADSHRVNSITQTDGSSVSFTYQLIAGEYRVSSFTDAMNRTTTLDYTELAAYLADPDAVTSGDADQSSSTHELDESQLTPGNVGGGGGATHSHGVQTQSLIPGSVGSWATAQSLPADHGGLIKFNVTGDGIAVRLESTESGGMQVFARLYNPVNDTWSGEVRLDDPGDWDHHNVVDVALDDDGNAVVLLMPEGPNGFAHVTARVYDAGTQSWSAAVPLVDPQTNNAWAGSLIS